MSSKMGTRMQLTLNKEELKDLEEGIRRALNENYILKPEGETDEDCIVHDILVAVENLLKYRYR